MQESPHGILESALDDENDDYPVMGAQIAKRTQKVNDKHPQVVAALKSLNNR